MYIAGNEQRAFLSSALGVRLPKNQRGNAASFSINSLLNKSDTDCSGMSGVEIPHDARRRLTIEVFSCRIFFKTPVPTNDCEVENSSTSNGSMSSELAVSLSLLRLPHFCRSLIALHCFDGFENSIITKSSPFTVASRSLSGLRFSLTRDIIVSQQ